MLLIYGTQGTGYGQEQNNLPEFTPVSERTPQVRDTIVALVPGVDSANDVTAAHLALITNFNLSDQSITALKPGDFDGLSSLRSLSLAENTLSSLPTGIFSGLSSINSLNLGSNQLNSLPIDLFSGLSSLSRINLSFNRLSNLPDDIFSGLFSLIGLDLGSNQLSSLPADIFFGLASLDWLSLSNNELSSLPADIFSGLASLRSLYLGDNAVDLSITVSLEQVGENQFKGTVPIGAPFNIVLPLSVTNGSIDGAETTTITIPAGSVESELLTVTRTLGTSDDIIVAIGTLPELPTSHYGYRLVEATTSDGDNNSLSFAIGIPDYNVEENHAPVFIEGISTTRTVAENTAAGVNIGGPVSATDEDDDMLTYTLGGADAASFGLVGVSGQLQTRAPLDYEMKDTYSVVVTVSDGRGAVDTIGVAISVTDQNDDPVFIEGNGTTRTVAENTSAGVNIGSAVSATDEDGDPLTYSLGGIDASSFGIISTSGQLQTRAELDYETKDSYSVHGFRWQWWNRHYRCYYQCH